MKASSLILVLCIEVLVGLVSNGWGQTVQDSEKLVKAVIEQIQTAIDAHDLDLLLAQFSDDAMIDTKVAGAKVSKAAYKEAMSRLWQRDTKSWSEQKGLQVSLADATHAVAQGTLYIHLTNGSNVISKYEWKLEKRDGRWLVVETNYK